MFKFIGGLMVGAVVSYAATSYLNPQARHSLDHQQSKMVDTYIHNHKLQKLLKLSLLSGYSQLNRGFFDYGFKVKLDGFNFYGCYFQKDQIQQNENSKISKSHFIFSPREELCGHPNIQHGGATATIIDQHSGMLAMLYSHELVATADLFVKYVKPVKKGQLYVWSGRIEKRQDRKIYVNSEVKELETGNICALGETLFMTVQWEHKLGEVFRLLFRQQNIKQSK